MDSKIIFYGMGSWVGSRWRGFLKVVPSRLCLIFEPCQQKHWEVRKKHIADGPK